MRKRQKKRSLGRTATATPKLQAWHEDLTQPATILFLEGNTYRPDPIFDIAAADNRSTEYLVSPHRTFAYRNSILPAGTPLELSFGARFGYVVWDADVVLPTLIDMTRSSRTGEPFSADVSERHRATWGAIWMSLTPAEMLSQRPAVRKAVGKVLIGGLGLGWLLRKVCEQPTVEEVIVVEKSQELLDWFGYDLCKRQPKVQEVICNDVYDEVGHFLDHMYLLDIWPTFRGEDSAKCDHRLAALRARFGDRLWAWGID